MEKESGRRHQDALELLHIDRGGLYLDPKIGVHYNVVEIDFASLFPSIIASRNISPETMGCLCCNPEITGASRLVTSSRR